jgi:DNA polymerase-3 subunit delta
LGADDDVFNRKKFPAEPGGRIDLGELSDAIDTLPAFAEKTLIEVWDFDFGRNLDELVKLVSDLPEYTCVLFVCDTVEFKPDRRQKAATGLLKLARAVEFSVQEQSRLIPWICKHFESRGKKISNGDAEYLAFITGGAMTALIGEIEKLAAYAPAAVTRREIDALVAPVLEAEVYTLTDAVARRDIKSAGQVYAKLVAMRESPHKIISALSRSLRQLLLARQLLDERRGLEDFMRAGNVKSEYGAKKLISAARGRSAGECRRALLMCCDAAFALNSGGGEEQITQLLLRL